MLPEELPRDRQDDGVADAAAAEAKKSSKKGRKGGGPKDSKKAKTKDTKSGGSAAPKKSSRESKEVVTREDSCAARMPNFDGDYWPGLAEEVVNEMQNQMQGPEGTGKDGVAEKGSNGSARRKKRSRRDVDMDQWEVRPGQRDHVMTKLAQNIHSMKEDFIVVNLKPRCFHCEKYILEGRWWHCQHCKKKGFDYAVCADCHEKEMAKPEAERHPSRLPDVTHQLTKMPVMVTPKETKDPDPDILDSDFFDTRTTFLSLCQGNHYQFDQFRRAKHTSMMVLYHLHNPDAPAFTHTCNECQKTIGAGKRWTCDTCKDFDLCDDCKKTKGHQHKLRLVVDNAQSAMSQKEMRRRRAQSVQLHMQLLVHASQCQRGDCPSQNCSKMKALLKHGASCKIRAARGCQICRRIWALLQIHARHCKTQNNCPVPRCRDLKNHLRRLRLQQQASEDRRRHAATARAQGSKHEPTPGW